MKTIGSPGYVYKPLSEARRLKMQIAALARHGVKAGCHRINGVDVPDRFLVEIKQVCMHVRKKAGMQTGKRFTAALLETLLILESLK